MSDSWFTEATVWVSSNPGWLIVALFATALVESLAIAGILVPGVALLFAFAALAARTGLPLTDALLWAGLGAITGDLPSFALGRLLKARLHVVWPLSRYPGLIIRGERFFRTHGGKSVIIGRFVGPIRPIIPLVAGALHMPWRTFVGFNVLSAAGWALVYILPGYAVGAALASDIEPPPHFYPVLAISGAVLVAVYLILLQMRLGLGEGSRPYRWLEATMARYDGTHRFWRLYSNERPARRGEFPLPSLMMSVTALALFLILAQLLPVSSQLHELNQEVMSWFALLRQPLLDLPVIAITLAGDPPVLLAAAILAVLVLAFRGYYAAAIHIGAAGALATVSVWLLKAGFGIPRPEVVQMPPASGAFPSGHATGITVLVTACASFIAAESRQRKRWQTYVLLSLPLVPVALSRLYLGVHWFTDVLGGILLGLAITGAVRASYSRYDKVPLRPDPFSWAALVLWLAYALHYISSHWASATMAYLPAG